MSNSNIRNRPPIQKRNPRKTRPRPVRYVSCCLLENLLEQFGPDHPQRVGRVDLIP